MYYVLKFIISNTIQQSVWICFYDCLYVYLSDLCFLNFSHQLTRLNTGSAFSFLFNYRKPSYSKYIFLLNILCNVLWFYSLGNRSFTCTKIKTRIVIFRSNVSHFVSNITLTYNTDVFVVIAVMNTNFVHLTF